MSCSTCGCAPCACNNPSILNQPQIIQPTVSGGTFTTPQINSPTITNGQASGTQFTGVTIDATSTGFTQPPGTCDASLATTNYVCTALVAGINGTNPVFCNAVSVCLAGSPTLCSDIISCINSTPGALFNPIVFDPSVYASTLIVGVTRFATLAEVQGASCSLAIDPCTLGAFWSAGGPNALWATFESAVNSIIAVSPSICAAIDACLPTSATLCAAVAACGFAPLANPVFTGDPQAPTPAPGDNDTSIATTAFVVTGINNALTAFLPTCAQVTAPFAASGSAPGPAVRFPADDCQKYTAAQIGAAVEVGGFARGSLTSPAGPAIFLVGCSFAGVTVTFNTPQLNTNYIVLWSYGNFTAPPNPTGEFVTITKATTGFTINASFFEFVNTIGATMNQPFDFMCMR